MLKEYNSLPTVDIHFNPYFSSESSQPAVGLLLLAGTAYHEKDLLLFQRVYVKNLPADDPCARGE